MDDGKDDDEDDADDNNDDNNNNDKLIIINICQALKRIRDVQCHCSECKC
jgi:hypothetical protein